MRKTIKNCLSVLLGVIFGLSVLSGVFYGTSWVSKNNSMRSCKQEAEINNISYTDMKFVNYSCYIKQNDKYEKLHSVIFDKEQKEKDNKKAARLEFVISKK